MPALADVERELVKRNGLHEFIKLAWHIVEPSTPFIDSWHIKAVAEHVEALYAGDIYNLLINIPPRTSKSLTCSVFASAWAWIKWPSLRMIFVSYSENLSMADSIKTRQIIESPWYQERWGHIYQLSEEQNTKTNFETNRTGMRYSTSVGGTVVGKGATIITCDDLLSKDQAESQAFRERASRYRFEVLPSRFNDRAVGRSLDIQQRLHPNDTTGELLQREKDGRLGGLVKLILPLEYVPTPYISVLGFKDPRTIDGESLEPVRFGLDAIKTYKDNLGSYAYAGQMQQAPVPREGGMVKESWFRNRFSDELTPSVLQKKKNLVMIVESVDCASKPKQRNDPSVWGLWGIFRDIDEKTRKYKFHAELWDLLIRRVEFPEGIRIFKRRAEVWNQDEELIEDKDAGQGFIQQLKSDKDYRIRITPINPKGLDKGTRMSNETSMIERGELWIPESAPWLQDFLTQICLFTGNDSGGHDDIVDMTSQFLKWFRERFQKARIVAPSGEVAASNNFIGIAGEGQNTEDAEYGF